MPNFPTPSNPKPFDQGAPVTNRRLTRDQTGQHQPFGAGLDSLSADETHVVCVLTHDTVVKPEQRHAARARLLTAAAVQPILPPLTPPERTASRLWSLVVRTWRSISIPHPTPSVYERVRIPVGMMHHFNFDRYYTYKLISLPV